MHNDLAISTPPMSNKRENNTTKKYNAKQNVPRLIED